MTCDYQILKEENEKLRALIGELSQMEKLELAKTITSLSKENEKLKAENQQLTGISGQLKAENEELKRIKAIETKYCDKALNGWEADNEKNHEIIQSLRKDLEDSRRDKAYLERTVSQLKLELRKRDKASQVEHCEHSGVKLEVKASTPQKQPHICPGCNGTGRLQTKTPVGGVYDDLKKVPYEFNLLTCNLCNGTGIVWEG